MRVRSTLLVLILSPAAALAQPAVIMPLDINPGPDSSEVEYLTDVNGLVFFAASAPEPVGFPVRRLWVSDGSEEGTVPLPGNAGLDIVASDPRSLADAGGVLFFQAVARDIRVEPDELLGRELWRANGQPEGTLLVADIVPGSGSSSPADIVGVDGTVFFSAEGPDDRGRELWKSDGLPGGATVRVKDINPGPDDSMGKFASPVVRNGKIYFWADDGTHGFEMWVSDGTPGGTFMLRDINDVGDGSSIPFDPFPGVIIGSRVHRPFDSVVSGDFVFFPADDGRSGVELWKTDGTPENTERVLDLNETSPSASSSPAWLVDVDGLLYFTADDGITGRELWKTNGFGATGTQRVKDIRTGPQSSRDLVFHDQMVVRDGILYFAANDGTAGTALWRSDGTMDGTTPVADPSAQVDGFSPVAKLAVAGGHVYFVGEQIDHGAELYQVDGLDQTVEIEVNIGPIGAIPLIQAPRGIDLVGSGGRLFFPADDGRNLFGDELWVTVAEVPEGFDPLRVRVHSGAPPIPLLDTDLEVKVVSVPGTVESGQLFTYVYRLTNHGPAGALALLLDPLDGLAESFPPPPCVGGGPTAIFACHFILAPGWSWVFPVVVRAPDVAAPLQVSATPSVGVLLANDRNPLNNTAAAPTLVVPADPPPAGADLAVVKTARADPVLPGGPVEYEIAVLNNGPAPATGVMLTDPLPAGVSFVAATSEPADACSEDAATVTCSFAALSNGAFATVAIVGLAPATPGTITNTVTVAADQLDPEPVDNAYTLETRVRDVGLAPETGPRASAGVAAAALAVVSRVRARGEARRRSTPPRGGRAAGGLR